MKMISENLGRIIAALAAIALLVGCATAFRTDVSDFFDSVIGKETAIGDKVLGAMDAFDVGMNGSGGSDETQGGSGGSGETPVVLAPGLYETGTTNLLYSWDQLIADGVITVTDGVLTTGYDEEYDCSAACSVMVGDLIIDSSVTSIGDMALYGCYDLKSVTIPDDVTNINDQSFLWCSSLTSIIFGENSQLTSIGDSAFNSCSSLASITLPDSVTSIGDSAFYGCSSLASITLPDSVTSIGDSPFIDCSSLTSITVAPNNTVYHSDGNCLIQTASKLLIAGCQNSVIPSDGSVTSIGKAAFYGCTGLTSITIPDSVTSIPYTDTFNGCTGLTSITVAPNNTVYHSDGNCLILTARKVLIAGCQNSVIPSDGSVTTIANHSFQWCSSLTSINIPDSVTNIELCAFNGCALTDVYYTGDETAWNAISIGSGNYALTNATIHYNHTGE